MCAACWSSGAERIPDSISVYDVLPEGPRAEFDAARREMEAGRIASAQARLSRLALEHPDNIEVGVWLQEAEIASALGERTASASVAPTVPPSRSPPGAAASAPPAGADPIAPPTGSAALAVPGSPQAGNAASAASDPRLDALRQRYARQAEEHPTVARWVLAARVEPDEIAAKVLLDRAQALDPRCAWVHYARAWLAARASRWPEVKSEIALAKEMDPGHMPTRWLDAWMLARGGSVEAAMGALEVWLDKARGDLAIDVHLVHEAELDLALLSVLDGEPKRARDILSALNDRDVDTQRKWAAIAATDQALGEIRDSLAAAQRAEQEAPGEILPVVQQALLYESWLGDPDAAEAAWTRALALARSSSDLGALLERVRARVHAERLQAAREKRNATASR
jgi:hypothetical protein